PSIPFERGQERGLLAADVRSRTAVDHHLEVVPAAEDVPAEEAPVVRLGHDAFEDPPRPEELPPAVDERRVALDGVRGDDRPLEELMRVPLHELAVVEGPRLGFVDVHDEIRGLAGVLRDERPLDAGREAGTPAPSKTGCLHDLDDLLRAHREGPSQPFVAARLEVAVDPDRVGLAPPAREDAHRLAHLRGSSAVAVASGAPAPTDSGTPASRRETRRKSPGKGPRAGGGSSPRRSASISSETVASVIRS